MFPAGSKSIQNLSYFKASEGGGNEPHFALSADSHLNSQFMKTNEPVGSSKSRTVLCQKHDVLGYLSHPLAQPCPPQSW